LGATLRRGARLFTGDHERLLYTSFAAACTLWVALLFFSSMRQQILMLYASLEGSPLIAELKQLGPWSAPLDDVFIHFDFARATARGYPFQWSEGNGYSTGGTSLLYPFVLAFGYWIGFRRLWLMVWAAIVACVSVLGLLLSVRRLFRDLPGWTAYLAPPAVLCTGALSWNLFSGMEVAFLLGLWGGTLVAWDNLLLRGREGTAVTGAAAAMGSWGALMVATRPEAVTTVAVFSLSATAYVLRRRGWRMSAKVLAVTALPGVLIVCGQALVNHWLTGDAAAAGAVAKLEIYDPFRSPERVLADWLFFVRYQVERITQYHLADDSRHGWVVWLLAVLPLVPRSTRRYALLLWGCAITWVLVVALNGQVRWQNERYAMPALAWLLLLSALGVGAVTTQTAWQGWRRAWPQLAIGASVTVALASFLVHQQTRFREQLWFFGRASRNILEQHVQAGLLLRYAIEPPPSRIALGDAGAIPYVADLPALDLIGLGGYRQMPFARAKRLGIGAVLELVERIPPTERPDVMALYPSWWDTLPAWFGRRIVEVPVRGNVICGGASKVLYQSDWSAFAASATATGLEPGYAVVDHVDVADLLDERSHDYQLSVPRTGQVIMRILPHPERPDRDLWDAGRVVPPNVVESFVVRGFEPGVAARIVVRIALAQAVELGISVSGRSLAPVAIEAHDGWQHVEAAVPSDLVSADLHVAVSSKQMRNSFHFWAVQQR